jgi:hypothetical protein
MIRVQPEGHRRIPRDSPEVLALRAFARQYRARRAQRNAFDRQLWAQATLFYPAAAHVLTGKRARRDIHAALSAAPSPSAARKVRAGRISDALRSAGRSRGVPQAAADLLADFGCRTRGSP